MERIVLQMGNNGPSLGIALKMATGIEEIKSTLLIGDEICRNSQSMQRIVAWIAGAWSSVYDLSVDETEAFSPPIFTQPLELQLHTVPPPSEFSLNLDIPLRSTDVIDVRTGTKPMSMLLTNQGLDADSNIIYSDIKRGGFLNLETGQMFLPNAPHLSLMEHLWLSHHGPVLGTMIPDISNEWKSEELREIANRMSSNNSRRTISDSRNEFAAKLYEILDMKPPLELIVPRDSSNFKLETQWLRSNKHDTFAEALEILTAGICSQTIECEWRMNVRFLDPTAVGSGDDIGRKDRFRKSAPPNLHLTEQLNNLESGQPTQPLREWRIENVVPSYDSQRIVDDEFPGCFMHELDVIGYDQGKMYLISVKNKWVISEGDEERQGLYEELNQMLLRHRYQLNSHNCECILVTGMPISDRLKEVADEMGVHACFVLDLPELLKNIQN